MPGWSAIWSSPASRGQAGARLHIRIVALFSLVAAVPAALLAITASITLDRGLDNWFSTRTQAIVDNSLSLAQAFAEQQALLLRADILAVKSELERASSLHNDDPARFDTFLNSLAIDHKLPGVFLVSGDGSLITEAKSTKRDQFPPPVVKAIEQAKTNPDEVVVIAPGQTNIIGGITPLKGYNDVFLYGARPLDPKVVRYLAMTNDNVAEYKTLEASRFGMQLAFGILFLGVTVVVLLSAIWLGIGFANRLVAPIRRLIDAAKEVSRGNLAVTRPAAQFRRRRRRARQHVQHHDRPVAQSARGAGCRQQSDRHPPPLHRGGARRHIRRRRRHRRARAA